MNNCLVCKMSQLLSNLWMCYLVQPTIQSQRYSSCSYNAKETGFCKCLAFYIIWGKIWRSKEHIFWDFWLDFWMSILTMHFGNLAASRCVQYDLCWCLLVKGGDFCFRLIRLWGLKKYALWLVLHVFSIVSGCLWNGCQLQLTLAW